MGPQGHSSCITPALANEIQRAEQNALNAGKAKHYASRDDFSRAHAAAADTRKQRNRAGYRLSSQLLIAADSMAMVLERIVELSHAMMKTNNG